MKKVFIISTTILFLLLILSCKKNERPPIPPDITTAPVTEVLYTTATSGGIITNSVGTSVVTRGVCWGTSPGTSIEDSRTSDGAGTGAFESNVTGLTPGTLYYLRGYATNSAGTSYGSETSFTTHITGVKFNPDLIYGTVNDIEGISYKTIPIGIQLWMAENLKTSKLNDGTDIQLVIDNMQWMNLLTPGYCWFDNDKAFYGNIYGVHYNWFAVSTGKLCPAGWHVPSDSEWQLLVDYLGGNAKAGSKIKEAGTNNWIFPNSDATNSSGFTALPAGMRGSLDGTFSGQGYFGGWWSATELNPSPLGAVWSRWIHADTTVLSRDEVFKIDGFPVRCVKDN